MFDNAAKQKVSARFLRKATDFRSDERGSITIFVMLLFVMMVLVGGIAVDIMRSELRRVTYQQTFDRAVLAASNVVLPVSQTPQSVGQDWYSKAGLGDQFTVDYGTPAITGQATTSSRFARVSGTVRSYNWFMHSLNVPYFNIPITSRAQQGISKIEVIMVLDITGSMTEASGTMTKLAALQAAAKNFVTILKFNRDAQGNLTIPKDPNNLISIGMVPYSSHVNIPVALRDEFNVSNLSHWNGVPNQGVPDHNCLEIAPSTFGTMALSTTDAIPAAAIANTLSSNPSATITTIGNSNTTARNGGSVELGYTAPVMTNSLSGQFMCLNGDNPNTTDNETNPTTDENEAGSNLLLLPTTNITTVKNQIDEFNARGTTSIAVGMRWATALIDQSAQPIYSNLLGGEAAMAGRPANNNDNETRKIIVLMTDGDHVSSRHILDAYKTGLSPIWRGDDGNLAIRYNGVGHTRTGGRRPGINPNGTPAPVNSCSGWSLADTVVNGVTVRRDVFVPHLKATSVRLRNGAEAEGQGSGDEITGGCDPRAWVAMSGSPGAPSWPGSGSVRQLDWSEVWQYASVDWVIEQLFMRSNVVGATSYSNVYNSFVGSYLTSEANMDALLNTNCTAAKQAGVEVFGIVLGNNVFEDPIRNCASPGTGYYYATTDPASLNAAFERIAVLISDLKLTQ
jgi:uncharacterized membrane protein YphA (DoxX/SURF4 family)